MSLKNFSILFKEFDSNNSTNKKVRILIEYFLTNNSLDNSWTIYLLIGKNNKRFISGKLLRNYFSEIYSMPLWLIENCYTKVGDSAEVVALLLNNINFKNDIKEDISLEKLMRFHLPKLYSISDNEKKLYLKECWKNLSKEDFLIFNKILTGTFRVGVSRGLVTKALSSITEIEESIIAHRLMGKFEPSIKNFEFLTNKLTDQKELDYRPFPFQLANSFDEKIKNISVDEFQFEWKWDGIRSQLIKRKDNISIWTRGEELVNYSFPDLLKILFLINDDFVLDGEILIWDESNKYPKDFSFLQKRLGRKNPSLKIQKDLPITFIIYDLLELNRLDIRHKKLKERRKILEETYKKWNDNNKNNFHYKFQITELHNVSSWSEVDKIKDYSRNVNTEGLVIKNKNSKYISGRKTGNWWKYKVDPMQLDAVLIYAKSGSGKRADLYTDLSFGLWEGDKLVKFASAYSGLNNVEIRELDKWIRNNTIERFGPVRSVSPKLVFEISFENIQKSNRHKSGIAVRFPRISKWRKDKNINEADTLQNAHKLMIKI
tara:strand:+ start:5016 stop:6650 length:1635 start_codon:yes stop_codon:yes gene_type:complete